MAASGMYEHGVVVGESAGEGVRFPFFPASVIPALLFACAEVFTDFQAYALCGDLIRHPLAFATQVPW